MASAMLGKNNIKREEIDQILMGNKTRKNGDDEICTFLAFSNLSDVDSENSLSTITTVEKGLCQNSRKRGGSYFKMGTNNCMGLFLMLTMVLLGVSVLCLELYRTHEAYTLRKQVDGLKKDVENLKHRLLEEDLLSEIKAFEDAVYAEEATDDNEDDDDEYDYVEQEDPVNIQSNLHYGKHHTGSSTKYDQLQTSGNTVADKHNHKITNHDKNTEVISGDDKRMKRDVYEYEGGVPVIAESYGITNKTEGLRLYDSLVANAPEISYETTENPIKEHHRVSSSWPSKPHRKKFHAHHGQHGYSAQPDGYTSRQRLSSTHPPSPVISRPSRVMQTDKDPSRRVHHAPANFMRTPRPTPPSAPPTPSELRPKKNEGEIVVRVYQEQRAPPESTVQSIDVVDAQGVRHRRRKPARKTLSTIEGVEERTTPVPARHRLLPAAHYNGDSSHYTVQHEHYDGNGRLRHPDGVFTDWTASKWVQQLGMDRHFRFDNGVVNVKDTGLYFVYAQIYYLDEHDINGYHVYTNEEPMLQCTTMTHSMGHERVKKSNTCFTASAVFLKENDQISLRDIGGLRYSLFEPGKSFFGLIKLGSINIK